MPGLIREARRRLLLRSAELSGAAIQLDHECGGRQTIISACMRLSAAWCDLGLALLGHRE